MKSSGGSAADADAERRARRRQRKQEREGARQDAEKGSKKRKNPRTPTSGKKKGERSPSTKQRTPKSSKKTASPSPSSARKKKKARKVASMSDPVVATPESLFDGIDEDSSSSSEQAVLAATAVPEESSSESEELDEGMIVNKSWKPSDRFQEVPFSGKKGSLQALGVGEPQVRLVLFRLPQDVDPKRLHGVEMTVGKSGTSGAELGSVNKDTSGGKLELLWDGAESSEFSSLVPLFPCSKAHALVPVEAFYGQVNVVKAVKAPTPKDRRTKSKSYEGADQLDLRRPNKPIGSDITIKSASSSDSGVKKNRKQQRKGKTPPSKKDARRKLKQKKKKKKKGKKGKKSPGK